MSKEKDEIIDAVIVIKKNSMKIGYLECISDLQELTSDTQLQGIFSTIVEKLEKIKAIRYDS
jgi:hypothetical protein